MHSKGKCVFSQVLIASKVLFQSFTKYSIRKGFTVLSSIEHGGKTITFHGKPSKGFRNIFNIR